MIKFFLPVLFLLSFLISWCTQINPIDNDFVKTDSSQETERILHSVQQKVISQVSILDDYIKDEFMNRCTVEQEYEDGNSYLCTNIPLYIHSYTIPSLNLKWRIYDRNYYQLNEYSAPFYLTTWDHRSFVVSGNMLIDKFMTGNDKDQLWFNDYDFYIEKKYFWSGETQQNVIDNIKNMQFSGYMLEQDSLVTGKQSYQRYDGDYDIYQITYKINPERSIYPLMSVTYIFSPEDKDYYYVEYSKTDGGIWFKTEINRLQLFVE